MLLDIVQEKDVLKISKVNKKGNLQFMDIRIPRNQFFEWVLDGGIDGVIPEGKLKYWYNDLPVYKRKTNYLNKFRLQEILTNLDETTKEAIYEFNEPNKLFCDIETEVIDGFPNYKNPKERVTVVGVYDEKSKKAHVYGIKELSDKNIGLIGKEIGEYFKDIPEAEGIEFDYTFFSSEFDMLYHVFSKVFYQALVVTGWNFIDFDWNYMTARARFLGIDPEICSRDGKFYGKQQTPKHKLVVDYLEIFKKWGNVSGLENYTLDNVAEHVLGSKKIKFSGTLQQLYEGDFKNYVYYNIVDTILVHLIDRKKKTFLTMCQLAKLGGIETRNAFSPVRFTETVLCREFYNMDRVLVDGHNPFQAENERLMKEKGDKIEGGYVKVPEKGLFNILCSQDFASLYPTIMRMFNISPDSYLGQTDELKRRGGGLIKDAINTVMNTSFSKEPSIMRNLLDNYYGQRKSIKKEMGVLEPQIKAIKDELLRRKIKV
jgi:DNA polymerase elongation subunit (family B)